MASRVTITLPDDLRQTIADAAKRAGVPFSTVVADALAAWVRGQLLDAFLQDYEAEFGAFSEDELKAVAKETGIPYIPPEAAVNRPAKSTAAPTSCSTAER